MAIKNIEKLKQDLAPMFETVKNIGIVYFFGSQANGSSTQKSDFDFAIYFNESDITKRNKQLFDLSSELSKKLNTDKIDIHSLNDLYSPELKYHIISRSVVIFEREPHRLLVEPKILNEYFDFVYLLKKHGLTRAY